MTLTAVTNNEKITIVSLRLLTTTIAPIDMLGYLFYHYDLESMITFKTINENISYTLVRTKLYTR